MTDEIKARPAPQIQINTGDEITRGRYANALLLSYSREEFLLDWLLNSPSGAHLVSRIIVSPGHIKSIIETLKINMEQYEQKFGRIEVGDNPEQRFH